MTTSTAPLAFVDTETTGVHPGRLPWEIAIIRREHDGDQNEALLQISPIDLSDADPYGLKVGGFYQRGAGYTGGPIRPATLVTEAEAAKVVERMTRGAHIVGAVPNFDTETLAAMLRRHGLCPAWHYHLIDVETLAVGYLHGRDVEDGGEVTRWIPPSLPWSSDDLSRLVGVEPPSESERHTALGDARWAMRLYDAITSY